MSKKTIRDEYPGHPVWCPVKDKAIRERGGCKVYWYVFPTLELAEQCAAWALVEATIRERYGYDA